MSKHIVEETPQKGSHAKGDNPVEKQASQLAYDVKYKVKQAMNRGTKMNPAQVAKAYLSQLAKSPASPAVKALAKKKLMGEDHTSDLPMLAEKAIVNAMVKVFSEELDEKKYKVRVTDKKTGNTYVRNATRAKIAELRANPNISSVEMTSYGEISGDEKSKGKRTAAAKSGKDYDGDGKVESGAKEYRGAVHNAIQRKRGLKPDGKDTSSVREEFLGEVKEKEETKNKKITGEKVNNYSGKNAVVKVFPSLGEQAVGQEDEAKPLQKPQQKKPTIDPNEKRQLSNLQQFQNKERQLNQQKLAAQKSGRIPVGSVQTSSFEPDGDVVQESGDYWHPDPEQDRKLSNRGAKLRAREDQVADKKATSKPADDKKLRPGESYMDYAKRQGGASASKSSPATKPSIKDKLKNKLGKAIDKLGGINSSFEPDGEDIQEVAPPGAKSERMVKHIKKAYSKDGELTKKEKSIAYATAWKQHNKEVKEEKTNNKDESEDPRSIPTKVNLAKNKLRAMGLKMDYEPEGEVIDERRKEDKVAGTPRKPRNPAFELVAKSMGTGRMGVKPRGEKKVPGKKPPAAGEYGAPASPAQKVAKIRAAKKRAQDNMSSRFD